MKISNKLLLLSALLFLVFTGDALAQGKLKGTVRDKFEEPVAGATVLLYKDGGFSKGYITQEDGKYEFANLSPATYDLMIKYSKDTVERKGIVLSIGETRPLDVVINGGGFTTGPVEFTAEAGRPPIFSVDPINSETMTIRDIQDRGVRDLNSILSAAGNLYQADANSPVQIRGGRQGGTVTFIDGVKMVGTPGVPQPMYGQVSLISGGLPAEYGDVNGGVVAVTTRNPGMKGWTGKPANYEKRMERKERRKNRKERSELDPDTDRLYTFLDLNSEPYPF